MFPRALIHASPTPRELGAVLQEEGRTHAIRPTLAAHERDCPNHRSRYLSPSSSFVIPLREHASCRSRGERERGELTRPFPDLFSLCHMLFLLRLRGWGAKASWFLLLQGDRGHVG